MCKAGRSRSRALSPLDILSFRESDISCSCHKQTLCSNYTRTEGFVNRFIIKTFQDLPWWNTGFGGVSVRPHAHTPKSGAFPGNSQRTIIKIRKNGSAVRQVRFSRGSFADSPCCAQNQRSQPIVERVGTKSPGCTPASRRGRLVYR